MESLFDLLAFGSPSASASCSFARGAAGVGSSVVLAAAAAGEFSGCEWRTSGWSAAWAGPARRACTVAAAVGAVTACVCARGATTADGPRCSVTVGVAARRAPAGWLRGTLTVGARCTPTVVPAVLLLSLTADLLALALCPAEVPAVPLPAPDDHSPLLRFPRFILVSLPSGTPAPSSRVSARMDASTIPIRALLSSGRQPTAASTARRRSFARMTGCRSPDAVEGAGAGRGWRAGGGPFRVVAVVKRDGRMGAGAGTAAGAAGIGVRSTRAPVGTDSVGETDGNIGEMDATAGAGLIHDGASEGGARRWARAGTGCCCGGASALGLSRAGVACGCVAGVARPRALSGRLSCGIDASRTRSARARPPLRGRAIVVELGMVDGGF